MKYIHGCIGFCLLFLACQQEITPVEGSENLIGTWNLVEVLYDPGNGSGVFTPVDSEADISFFADGRFKANHDLCTLSTTANDHQTGVFSPVDRTLTPTGCSPGKAAITYQVNGDTLDLGFPCIEPCLHKYTRE